MAGWRKTLSATLVAGVFLCDTLTYLGGAFAVLYVIALLIAGGDLQQRHIVRWSISCAVLTLLSFAINHGEDHDTTAIMRMVISLSANIVTTYLIYRAQEIYGTLHESERRYRSIFDSLAVAVWEHDFRSVQAAIEAVRATGVTDLKRYVADHPEFVTETRRMVPVTDVNETAVRLMGFESKKEFFTRLNEFLPETDESFAECILAIDEQRAVFQAETRVRTRDGVLIDVIVAMGFDCEGPLDRVACSALNVTQAKRVGEVLDQTRSRLERAQRAAVLGQLSASIAHEINQPLSAIKSCANAATRWLGRDTPDIAEAKDALEMVVAAVHQADEVIRGVRTLTGTAEPKLYPLVLDELIKDCATLLQREIAEQGARIILDLGAPGVEIEADRILVQQVLVNLIMNAVQAMDETEKSLKLVTIKSGMADGGRIEVIVTDRGHGWSPQYLELAFEAFQTTKPEGMGLGLSICRAAIETHGGEIRLLNHQGEGACVHLSLPIFHTPMPQGAEKTA